MSARNFLHAAMLALLVAAAGNAAAQIQVNIQVGPPEPLFEPVPFIAPGTTWAPGYWAWHENRHIWIRGRPIAQRTGYRWAPDTWVRRGDGYHRQPGYWMRDTGVRPAQHMMLRERDRDDDKGGRGMGYRQGKRDKHGKRDKRDRD